MTTLTAFAVLSSLPALRFQMLLDVTLKGALILLAAVLLVVALRRAAAATRHLVWTLAVISLLALPVLSMALPGWQLPLLPELVNSQESSVIAAPVDVAELSATDPADERLTYPPLVETAAPELTAEAPTVSAAPPQVSNATPSVQWPQLVLLVWLTGAFIVLARLAVSVIRVWAIARDAELLTDYAWSAIVKRLAVQLELDRHIPLLKSDQVTMPMTWGIWRPVVLLPDDADEWSAEWRQIVLLHELAHIRRRDCLTQLLAQVACALYWFNPLVWIGARRLCVERELACDDYVLEVGTRASDYAGYLVDIARAMSDVSTISPVAVGMACSQLESRVRAILDPAVRRQRMTRRITALLTFAVVSFIIPLAALQPWANAAAQEKQKAEKSAAPLDTPQPKSIPQPAQPAPPTRPADPADLEAAPDEAADAADEQSRAEELRADLDEKRQELNEQIRELAELQARGAAEKISAAEVRRIQREIGKLQSEIATMAQRAARESTAHIISQELQQELAQVREKIDVRIATKLDREMRKAQEQALADGLAQSSGQQGKGESNALTADNIVQLKMYGVTPEYIEMLRRLGYDNLPVKEVVQLKMHGVTEEFIRDARSQTGEKLTVSDLVQLKMSGISPDYIREMKKAGYDLPLKSLARMRMMGVTPEYIETLRKIGFSNLSAEQITRLKMHGVTENYIKEMRGAGFSNLSADDLTKMRMHGVTPAFIEALRRNGYSNLTAEQLTRLRMFGVTEDWIKELRDAGFDKLTVDELIKMRMHGVTGDYIRKMRAAGFKNVSANQLIELKMRGIDEILLKK